MTLMNTAGSHLVLIPSYNTGTKLVETVSEALRFWQPVWVIIDGSTDGSETQLAKLKVAHGALRVITLPRNEGKGAAVIAGMQAARQDGFTQALVMDADGQHPAPSIPEFMRASIQNPTAMILGVPDFGPDAPAGRRFGRWAGNGWTNLATLWGGVQDSLFGFRVYPIAESLAILQNIKGARRYDFDTELVVRLYWRGIRPINLKAPVKYFSKHQGGVSHFNYFRDNLLLIRTHTFLFFGMLAHFFAIWRLRKR